MSDGYGADNTYSTLSNGLRIRIRIKRMKEKRKEK